MPYEKVTNVSSSIHPIKCSTRAREEKRGEERRSTRGGATRHKIEIHDKIVRSMRDEG